MENKIACEREKLVLECKYNGILMIAAANYGRTDEWECTKGYEEQDTKCCNEDETLHVVKRKCDWKKRCKIRVDKYEFGEPCIGTTKYLNVSYSCVDRGYEDKTTPLVTPSACATISTIPMTTSVKGSSISPTDGGSAKTTITSTRIGTNSTIFATHSLSTDLPSSTTGSSNTAVPAGAVVGVVACVIVLVLSLVLCIWFYKKRNIRKLDRRKTESTWNLQTEYVNSPLHGCEDPVYENSDLAPTNIHAIAQRENSNVQYKPSSDQQPQSCPAIYCIYEPTATQINHYMNTKGLEQEKPNLDYALSEYESCDSQQQSNTDPTIPTAAQMNHYMNIKGLEQEEPNLDYALSEYELYDSV